MKERICGLSAEHVYDYGGNLTLRPGDLLMRNNLCMMHVPTESYLTERWVLRRVAM